MLKAKPSLYDKHLAQAEEIAEQEVEITNKEKENEE